MPPPLSPFLLCLGDTMCLNHNSVLFPLLSPPLLWRCNHFKTNPVTPPPKSTPSLFSAPSSPQRVTFQAVIMSDGSTTYVMYIYGQGGMNFDPVLDRSVEAGWLSQNLDTRANYYVFDMVIGNTGQEYNWTGV